MLTVIATIESKADCIESAKSEMLKMIEPTLKEDGCIDYTLHQDNDNPAVFIFYETWHSEDDLQEHIKTPHMQEFLAATKDMLAGFKVNKLTVLS
ncbi:MAG: antibiotic biosynthesis monooxygenase [Gammaproteobacteria bacterium]|nr:MAG: antibiotic biosynthesis monooxygenase [Gammaproteobacteria bacterium]